MQREEKRGVASEVAGEPDCFREGKDGIISRRRIKIKTRLRSFGDPKESCLLATDTDVCPK